MNESPPAPIFTVGHSTRTIDEFVGLLGAGRVEMVIDIRSVPRSRTNPQYNLDAVPETLETRQIGHRRIEALGGLRGRSPDVPPHVNAFWRNRSFHNYADHALSDEFEQGLDELLAASRDRRCAIMCAEAVWWRCHRRIVADYLLFRGRAVAHLMGDNRVDAASMTPAATPLGNKLVYPAPDDAASVASS